MSRPELPAAPLVPCDCPEASLLREILAGQVPAADTPTWRALAAAIDTRASRLALDRLKASSTAIADGIDAQRAAVRRARGTGYDPGPGCGRYFCPGERWCVSCPLDHHATTDTSTTENAA